jgi:hypothetical protein
VHCRRGRSLPIEFDPWLTESLEQHFIWYLKGWQSSSDPVRYSPFRRWSHDLALFALQTLLCISMWRTLVSSLEPGADSPCSRNRLEDHGKISQSKSRGRVFGWISRVEYSFDLRNDQNPRVNVIVGPRVELGKATRTRKLYAFFFVPRLIQTLNANLDTFLYSVALPAAETGSLPCSLITAATLIPVVALIQPP